MAVVDPVV